MKKLAFLTLAFFSMTLAVAQKKTEKAVIQTTLYCNHCKACETCGQNFQKNMLKIKGVKMYDLDEAAMKLTVYFDPKKTNLDKIRQGIANLGFDADEVKANPEAYEKLDDCCKKA